MCLLDYFESFTPKPIFDNNIYITTRFTFINVAY